MQKETVIILGATGCVFLAIPSFLLNPTVGPASLSLPAVLLTFVLVYAVFDVRRLLKEGKNKLAVKFVGSLLGVIIISIIFSIIILIAAFPYFGTIQ